LERTGGCKNSSVQCVIARLDYFFWRSIGVSDGFVFVMPYMYTKPHWNVKNFSQPRDKQRVRKSKLVAKWTPRSNSFFYTSVTCSCSQQKCMRALRAKKGRTRVSWKNRNKYRGVDLVVCCLWVSISRFCSPMTYWKNNCCEKNSPSMTTNFWCATFINTREHLCACYKLSRKRITGLQVVSAFAQLQI
jgi:hypothetical protein